MDRLEGQGGAMSRRETYKAAVMATARLFWPEADVIRPTWWHDPESGVVAYHVFADGVELGNLELTGKARWYASRLTLDRDEVEVHPAEAR
jgi:hypothetical protein